VAKAGKGTAEILSSEMIYQGRVLGWRRDEVVEPSGVRTTREVITHPGSVVVLPVLPDGRIVMIRQYRHATRQYLWELVAGERSRRRRRSKGRRGSCWRRRDTGETVQSFPGCLPTPGFLEERMYLLLAEGLTAGEAQPEEDEKIEVRTFKLKS